MHIRTTEADRPRSAAEEGSGARLRFTLLQERLLAHYGVRAASRYLELATPRMRVHLLDAGAGEPVVILHGGDGEAVNWAPLMGPLQGQARIFAVDRPSFGLSDRFDYRHVDLRRHAGDFVESLLDALGLERATLVGGSMGGFFALAAAIDRPQRVERLVLFGYALGMVRELPAALRLICGVPGLARLFMRGRDTLEAQRRQYRDMFRVDPATVPQLYFETRIAGIRLPSEKDAWATLLHRIGGLRGVRPEVYLGDELGAIAAPTLILWGERDMASAQAGRAAAERIPDVRFETLAGVGHFPFLEAPELAAEHVTKFLHCKGHRARLEEAVR